MTPLLVPEISPSGFFVTRTDEERADEELGILVVGLTIYHDNTL